MDIKIYSSKIISHTVYGISLILCLLTIQPGTIYAGSVTTEWDHLNKWLVSNENCSNHLPGLEAVFPPPQLAPPVIIEVNSTSPTDCGLDDGTITINASSTDPMEYSINFGMSWFPNNLFTGLPAGSYTILVRNIGEVDDVAYMNNPVILTAPTPPVVTSAVGTNPSDCATADGTITVTATPGDGTEEYSVDGGQTWQASNVFSSLLNGVYNVFVRNDNQTCPVPYANNPMVLNAPDAPNIQSVTTSPASDCGVSDGEIVIVANGNGPLEYSIDGGANWRTVNTFSDVAAGEHNVLVRNLDGTCPVLYPNNPVTVGGPAVPVILEVITQEISDCGATDGSINISATPGVGALEYSIDGGFLYLPDSSFNNLGPGTYSISVRYLDQSCQVQYTSNPIILADPEAPVITAIDSVDVSGCTTNNGSITVTANGDRPLFYSLDGGVNYQTSNVFTDLPEGTYDVVVSYVGEACQATHPGIVLENDGTGQITVTTTAAEACLNGTGDYSLSSMNISVDGAPLNSDHTILYTSMDGSFTDATDPNTTFTVNTNAVGTSTIEVSITDNVSGCSDNATLTFEILESPVIDMMPATICSGEPTTLNSGATGLHTWSVLSGDVNSLGCTNCPGPIVNPVVTTVYQVSVVDVNVNTCEAIDSVTITVAPSPTVVNHRDTIGLCTGNILPVTLELSEGIMSYNISSFTPYSNEVMMGNTLSFDIELTGSSALFSVDLTGVGGCTTTDNFVVRRVDAPTASFNYDIPACAQTDVLVNFTGTASSSAVLSWDLIGGTIVYSSPQMGSLPAGNQITTTWPGLGTYSIRLAVDDGGCMAFDTMQIMINETAPQLTYTTTEASSCGTTLGSIDLTATGSNNDFIWEGVNGYTATTEDISNLEAGMYSVTVTNTMTMCTSVETVMVEEDGLFNCTDVVRMLIPAIDPFSVCLDDVVNLPGTIVSASVCDDDPSTVTVAVNQTDDCVILDPNDLFVGEDTVCVVHCDGNAPVNCDTTYIVAMVSPPVDTIMVNILANIQSEVCIPAGVLQIGGTITSSAFCGTGDPSAVEGIALVDECVTLRAAPGFTGLAPDYICVINCYDNFALFCDTTYIEVTVDPNNCADYIVEENLAVAMLDCTVPEQVCIGIPFSDIANHEVRDNGVTYTGGFAMCGTDSTLFNLGQGVHVLSFIDMVTGCPDTVIVDVDNGLDIYSGQTDFMVECDSVMTFCLEVPYGDMANYSITDNGDPISSTGGCGLDSFYIYDYSNIPDQGGVGPYLLQNWTVNGSVFIGSFNTIDQLVDSMNVWDPTGNWSDDPTNFSIIGGDFANNYSATMAVSQVLGGSGTIDLNIEYVPQFITVDLDVNTHVLVVTHVPSACSETITFNIECDMGGGCDDTFDTPVVLNAASCDDLALFCTGISTSDFANYNVYDNGVAYSGDFEGCDNTESTLYSFVAVPGQGSTGPYDLISWSVGTNIFSGITFNTLDELLAEMQTWDPAGNWVLNGAIISGGVSGAPYGAIRIEYNGGTYPVYPTTQVISASTALELDTGYHQIILEYIPDGCLDTVDVTVNCVDCPDFIAADNEAISLLSCDADAVFCVEIPFADIGNYAITDNGFPYGNGTLSCPGSAGLSTQLTLGVGVHELVFTENSSGCSDTLGVVVSCLASSTQVVELLLNTSDTLCADDTQLLGNIISNTNECPDASGEYAVFTPIAGTYCYQVDGVEVGSDTACIVLCDDGGVCDTTYMIVNVVEELNPNDIPYASSDITQTIESQLVTYNVLDNDLINGTLDTFYILNQPDNGFAWYDPSGAIHYQPDDEYCDYANPEMIAYAICNENACDTSELLITVVCDEIQTYSGFSPNGDGVNDNFTIQGIESYPENQLFIFSRWGTLIFKVTSYQNDWDGTWNGQPLPEGTYFYIFDTGQGESRSGYVQINR